MAFVPAASYAPVAFRASVPAPRKDETKVLAVAAIQSSMATASQFSMLQDAERECSRTLKTVLSLLGKTVYSEDDSRHEAVSIIDELVQMWARDAGLALGLAAHEANAYVRVRLCGCFHRVSAFKLIFVLLEQERRSHTHVRLISYGRAHGGQRRRHPLHGSFASVARELLFVVSQRG